MTFNPGNKGLANLGNTCYMNSAIQCLSHLLMFNPKNKVFMEDIVKRNKENDEELMIEWVCLQQELWNDEQGIVNPSSFLRCFKEKIKKYNFYFESFDQNDVEEFITRLMELLHKAIERKITFQIDGVPENNMDRLAIKSMEVWKDFFESNYSYIINKTYSQLLSITSCTKCDNVSTNHDPILVISLEIKDNDKNIYDCFGNYTKVDKLDNNNLWKCDKCNIKNQPERKLLFWNLSDVLIIQLKRFTSSGRKKNEYIEYPELLNMSKYSINYAENSMRFKLMGLCIQDGSLNGGHYYAICKNELDKKWHIYNDTNVSNITKQDVFNKRPYCLFYKRID